MGKNKEMSAAGEGGIIGQPARKVSGYGFPGEIRSVFTNRAGAVRYVVEATGDGYEGMLHIFNGEQLGIDAAPDRAALAEHEPGIFAAITPPAQEPTR